MLNVARGVRRACQGTLTGALLDCRLRCVERMSPNQPSDKLENPRKPLTNPTATARPVNGERLLRPCTYRSLARVTLFVTRYFGPLTFRSDQLKTRAFARPSILERAATLDLIPSPDDLLQTVLIIALAAVHIGMQVLDQELVLLADL